jgi:hypothetical protein
MKGRRKGGMNEERRKKWKKGVVGKEGRKEGGRKD